jgi:LmbE family N-acetylglucosaminyl deacetylase
MSNTESILIVAPHADDETLGCGGAILKHLSEGCKVYWLLCTEFYRNGKTDENVALRSGQIAAVASTFGFTQTFEFGYQAASLTPAETEFAPAVPASAFIPNVFVNISDHFEKKLEIMQLYKTEVMGSPLPRSLSAIRALTAYRGSSIGESFAEAFVLLKQIVK